ncbi:MAG: sugar ABC transporter substrate-binding protein [Anaerolineaceae bacterium]|nr:sugar ABC transporter substrate-binding protein [Anaerolineaceae bacterium]
MSESIKNHQLGRRAFLKVVGTFSAGALLVSCAPKLEATPTATAAGAAELPTSVPPAKGVITIRATNNSPIDQLDAWSASIKDDLAAKNIKLELYQTAMGNSWSEYADKIVTQLAGGEQLDVLDVAIEGLPLMGSKDVLVDLKPFLEADPTTANMVKNDISPVLTDMLTYKGKLLEIPFSWNNMVLYYNTKIMADAGIKVPLHMTWDEFLSIAKQVANVKGTAQDRYAYNFWPSGTFGWDSWLYMNGGQGYLTDDLRDSNLNSPQVAETIQFMADLILKHKVAPNPAGWDEQGQFLAGNLVMRTVGHWGIGGLLQNNFADYDLVYQPHKSGSVLTVAGTDGWGVCTKSKYQSEAFAVIAALSSDAPYMQMLKLGGSIPARKSIAEKPEFTQYGPKNTAIFYESLAGAKAVQAPTNFNIIEPIVNRNFTPIWSGEATVEAALAKAHTELQAEMDKIKS